MSAGQIAALIAAGAFVLLVLLLAVPLIKLGRTLDEATLAIRKTHEGADPLLVGADTAINPVPWERKGGGGGGQRGSCGPTCDLECLVRPLMIRLSVLLKRVVAGSNPAGGTSQNCKN